MVVLNDIIYWGDTPEELAKKYEVNVEDCKSVTFIASRLEDNKILMESDPGYLANLKAMTEVDTERLLRGNWKIKAAAGSFVIIDVINRQLKAGDVRSTVLVTAKMDHAKYAWCRQRLPQDPGQAGKDQKASYMEMLAGFDVHMIPESGDKATRAEPMAAQWQHGMFDLVAGEWNEASPALYRR